MFDAADHSRYKVEDFSSLEKYIGMQIKIDSRRDMEMREMGEVSMLINR